jgi:SAM-dependent methyltransferase
MPTVEQNREMWGRRYRWPDAGDEWSSGWGGPRMQWDQWLLPRLLPYLPGAGSGGSPGRIVEIGCGHGRWTQFLSEHAGEVVAVDLSPSCVDACRQRFADVPTVRAEVVDGRSLPAVVTRSTDLVFSFDSLVHADASSLDGYLAAAARILTADGVAFIHHSNLRSCRLDRSRALRRVAPIHRLAARAGIVEQDVHWRDPTVDADVVLEAAARHGLHAVSQELLRWSTRRAYIDCISVLVRPGSVHDTGPLRRVRNEQFANEMAAAAQLARDTEAAAHRD